MHSENKHFRFTFLKWLYSLPTNQSQPLTGLGKSGHD